MNGQYAIWDTLRPQSDHCCQGKAEVRIFNFKTTWSEFQKASHTATEQCEAELCILEFKPRGQSSRNSAEVAPTALNYLSMWF